MPFSRGYLPHSRIKPVSLTSCALASRFFTTSATWEVQIKFLKLKKKKQTHLLLLDSPPSTTERKFGTQCRGNTFQFLGCLAQVGLPCLLASLFYHSLLHHQEPVNLGPHPQAQGQNLATGSRLQVCRVYLQPVQPAGEWGLNTSQDLLVCPRAWHREQLPTSTSVW